MANIAKVLKDEIQRLARREINRAAAPLRKANTLLKKTASDHRQKIAALEKEVQQLQHQVANAQPALAEPPAAGVRITGQNIRSLRGRLRITQEEFAKIVGSSVQIVPRWEKKRGSIAMRNPQYVAAIARLQSMKKADVQQLLGRKGAGKQKNLRPKPAADGNYQSNITAAMIKSARKRLGISQAAFAKSVGMSNQIISKWESKSGKLVLRNKSTEARILEVIKH